VREISVFDSMEFDAVFSSPVGAAPAREVFAPSISGADLAGWPFAPSRSPPSRAGRRAFSATNGEDKLRVN
jgi:hypothetical protein